MGKVVRVQQIPAKETKPVDADRLCEELCYHYQQYTFAMARKLPYKRLASLLRTARREQARHYYELVQIATAPHTKDGKGVETLIKSYEDRIRHG